MCGWNIALGNRGAVVNRGQIVSYGVLGVGIVGADGLNVVNGGGITTNDRAAYGIYAGDQAVIVGRYNVPGDAKATLAGKLAGGIYTPSEDAGDCHKFTRGLADAAAGRGVKFLYGATARGLVTEADRVVAVRTSLGDVTADAFVMALGINSLDLLRPLGIKVPLYPINGYSLTLPIGSAHKPPRISITDTHNKVVYAPLGDRLRIAGTAELNGYDRDLNRVRCEAIVRRVEQLFPGAGDTTQAQFWTGLRPATPSNVPIIGRCKLPNLFLNTGHGTLGWTHSCGSGKALADIVSGRAPEVDFAFQGLQGRAAGAALVPSASRPMRLPTNDGATEPFTTTPDPLFPTTSFASKKPRPPEAKSTA